MIPQNCFIFLLKTCLFLSICKEQIQPSQTSIEEVTEIAIYAIAQEKNQAFKPLLQSFQQQISQLEGFKDYQTLQAIETSNIYVDLVRWERLDLALAASDAVKHQAQFQPFVKVIDSLILYREFYPFQSFIHQKNKNMQDKVTEVVIYKIKSDKVSEYTDIANSANTFLSQQSGFIKRDILQDHKTPNIFMDIVLWENIDAAQQAMQLAQQTPSLAPFFEATEEIVSFSHYQHFK